MASRVGVGLLGRDGLDVAAVADARDRFRLLVGRLKASDPDAVRRREGASLELSLLSTQEFFVADRYTIADIAIYGYTHLAHQAGLDRLAFERIERVHSSSGRRLSGVG